MKFEVKVRLKEGMTGNPIRTFFEELAPQCSIIVEERETKFAIVLDNNSMENIETIELSFGKETGEDSQKLLESHEQLAEEADVYESVGPAVIEENVPNELNTVETETETSKQSGLVNAEEISEQPEQANSSEQVAKEKETTELSEQETMVVNTPEQPKKRRGRVKVDSVTNIPELEEIAKKSTSFEDFVKKVAEWLEITTNRLVFFESLIEAAVAAAEEVDTMSWKEIEKILKDKGVVYKNWDRIWTGNTIAQKLKYTTTLLPFVYAMTTYKNYSFGNSQISQDIVAVEDSKEDSVEEEHPVAEIVPTVEEQPVQSEEVPNGTIEDLSSTVGMTPAEIIDNMREILDGDAKTVEDVLSAMGSESLPPMEQNAILEIANVAVQCSSVSDVMLEDIFSRTNIPEEKWLFARLSFSKFINEFFSEKVRLIDFLAALQEIVS